MTINYGKRDPGGLTASDPGDTLYIPFATYNDSGASIAMSGFAVTDIEIYKNGIATARATDSGYSVISDTGQYGDNVGLNRFSVQIFNTADDTGFYESGAQYHVSVDSITVDGRTVKFFPAVFELGVPEVDVKRIDGDTGAADRLGKLAGLQLAADGTLDTGSGLNNVTASLDTGAVVTAIWDAVRADHTTAGSFGASDTGINERLATIETGVNVTSIADTGLNNRLDVILADTDTGIQGGVNVSSFSDTGVNNVLSKILSDTDTGIQSSVNVTTLSDTGVNAHFTAIEAGVTVTSLSDTGAVSNAVWNSVRTDHATATTFGQYVIADVDLMDGDTGAADVLQKFADSAGALSPTGELDTGSGTLSVSATTDTGQVSSAVWNSLRADHTTAGSFGASDTGINERLGVLETGVNVSSFADTGINDRLAKILADTDTGIQGNINITQIRGDTGAADRLLKFTGSQLAIDGTLDTGSGLNNVTASVDTGAVANAIWDSARADHTTAGTFGQYVTADADLVDGDTGAATHLRQFSDEYDTGRIAAEATATLDTGAVVNAVWNSLRADHIVAGSFGASDTGINERLSTLETGVNVTSLSDTGINNRLAVILADTDTGIQSNVNVGSLSDTGVNNVLGKILSDTDTGIQSSVNVTSIADTGLNNRLDVILSDTDTGIQSSVNVTSFADTGVNGRLTTLETGVNVSSFADTGINNVLAKILADTDTGIQTSVVVTGFSDTGINDRLAKILADTDTGIQSSVNVTGFSDTGVNERLTALETGVNVTSIADTGLNNRLDVILADTDTGIQSGVIVVGLSDTGVNARLAAISAKTDSLTFTVAGEIDANIQSVNDVAVTGTGASGTEWGP